MLRRISKRTLSKGLGYLLFCGSVPLNVILLPSNVDPGMCGLWAGILILVLSFEEGEEI